VQVTTLLDTLKSGKITVSRNGKETIEVNVTGKKIDVNAEDKEFIKEIMASVREAGPDTGVKETLRIGADSLGRVKELADDLCREGRTITLSYKGDRVLTIGAEADSKLMRLVTGTKGVEINSPLKLAELGL
jgi:hypothetical protein